MCESPLPQFEAGPSSSGGSGRCDDSIGALPNGHACCGWPLNDGTMCKYTGQSQHVTRHRNDFANHSNHRSELAERQLVQAEHASSIFKRPRPSEYQSPTVTSSTRQPAAAAAAAAVAAAAAAAAAGSSSSTHAERFAAAKARDADRLRQFQFVHPDAAQRSRAEDDAMQREREQLEQEQLEQEQARIHQEQAQFEGSQFMAVITAAAAQAATQATAALTAQIDELTQQLQGLPAAVARDVPAAVRDHDEAEALRLSNEALESSLQRQVRPPCARESSLTARPVSLP